MKKHFKLFFLSSWLVLATSCATWYNHPTPPTPPAQPVTESQTNDNSDNNDNNSELSPVAEEESPPITDTTPTTPPPPPPPMVKTYYNNSVYFDFDHYDVDNRFDNMLQSNIDFLNNNIQTKVTVIGNTDKAGSVEYNLSLGQKRANSVKNMLIKHGVNKSQIETVSLGKSRRKFSRPDEGKNRRVDLVYKTNAPDSYSMSEIGIPQMESSTMIDNKDNALSNDSDTYDNSSSYHDNSTINDHINDDNSKHKNTQDIKNSAQSSNSNINVANDDHIDTDHDMIDNDNVMNDNSNNIN